MRSHVRGPPEFCCRREEESRKIQTIESGQEIVAGMRVRSRPASGDAAELPRPAREATMRLRAQPKAHACSRESPARSSAFGPWPRQQCNPGHEQQQEDNHPKSCFIQFAVELQSKPGS